MRVHLHKTRNCSELLENLKQRMADVSKTKKSDRSLNHSTSWSQDPTGKILRKDPLPHHLVS